MNKDELRKFYDDRLIAIVKYFLETNGTNPDVANKFGLTVSVINRNLIDQERIIRLFDLKENEIEWLPLDSKFDSYGEFIWHEIRLRKRMNSSRGIEVYRKIFVNKEVKEFNALINLNDLYASEERQYTFLVSAALTFRMGLENLARLIGKDINLVESKIFYYRANLSSSLNYLFYYANYDQNKALQDFLTYYNKLLETKNGKDKKGLIELINVIGDNKIKRFLVTPVDIDSLSLEELEDIVNYQLKYALDYLSICRMFHFKKHIYYDRVKKILGNKPELEKKMDQLMKYIRNQTKVF